MQKFFVLELLFIMFIFYIKSGESIKCYVCRSDENKDCGVNVSLSKDCAEGANSSKVYCRKIYQLLKFKKERSYTSIRECAYEKSSQACYLFKWPAISYQTTCECEGNLCNQGTSIQFHTLGLIFTCLIWIIHNVS